MSEVIVAGIGIQQDRDGRFSLNDFHRAAGGEARHKPSEWMRLGQAQELADEVGKAGIPALRTVRGGRSPGTYACRELIYAYAMWVSPKFHLKVIRTFDAVVSEQVRQVDFAQGAFKDFQVTRLELITTVADMTEQSLRVAGLMGLQDNQGRFYADKLVKRQIGVGPLELLGITALPSINQDLYFTPKQLGERSGLTPQAFNRLLKDLGYQESNGKGKSPAWCPTVKGQPWSRYEDTGRQHNSGAPVTVLRWQEGILDELKRRASDLGRVLRPVARG